MAARMASPSCAYWCVCLGTKASNNPRISCTTCTCPSHPGPHPIVGYLTGWLTKGGVFSGHNRESPRIGAGLFGGFGIAQETSRVRLRSALDAPPAELIDALGRQANVGHHGNTIVHQAADGWRHMPTPFQFDRLGSCLLEKACGIG